MWQSEQSCVIGIPTTDCSEVSVTQGLLRDVWELSWVLVVVCLFVLMWRIINLVIFLIITRNLRKDRRNSISDLKFKVLLFLLPASEGKALAVCTSSVWRPASGYCSAVWGLAYTYFLYAAVSVVLLAREVSNSLGVELPTPSKLESCLQSYILSVCCFLS